MPRTALGMSEGDPENEGIETNSLFVLGEGMTELVAVVVEPRVVGILRLTPRAPHGDLQPKRPVTEETVPPA
jgi:hypothetical protein